MLVQAGVSRSAEVVAVNGVRIRGRGAIDNMKEVENAKVRKATI